MAAPYDIILRTVPSDIDSDDVRLYTPGEADAPPVGGATPLRMLMGIGE